MSLHFVTTTTTTAATETRDFFACALFIACGFAGVLLFFFIHVYTCLEEQRQHTAGNWKNNLLRILQWCCAQAQYLYMIMWLTEHICFVYNLSIYDDASRCCTQILGHIYIYAYLLFVYRYSYCIYINETGTQSFYCDYKPIYFYIYVQNYCKTFSCQNIK